MSADTSQTITVTDGNGFEPWYLEWGSGVWKKTYISITDYSEDGTYAAPATRSMTAHGAGR